jgi:hypothetical protein
MPHYGFDQTAKRLLPMNMLKALSITLLCFLLTLPSFAQKRISLQEALDQKKVRIDVQGTGEFGGESMLVRLRNISREVLLLLIPAGQIFASADTAVQDQINTSEIELALGPGEKEAHTLFTMCTQSWNMAPRRGEQFRLGDMAKDGLLKLAQKISSKKYHNSTAQSAVWSLINDESVRRIYGQDTSMVREIARIVSEERNIPLDSFLFTPREHRLTVIRTSLEGLFADHIKGASLGLYNGRGIRVCSYFTNRNIEKGFSQFRVGANHYEGDDAELYLRLLGENGEVLMERQVFSTDSVTPTMKFYQQAVMHYEVEENTFADIGVYDEEDRLYFVVKENHPIRKGRNRGTYIAGHQMPYGHDYYMKIKVDGQTIAEQKLDPNAPPPVLHDKIRLQGSFQFTTQASLQDAEIAIYTEAGEKRRVIYEIQHLNRGKRALRYQYEHFDGPEQEFFIRLTDKDGDVVAEKCISCK